MIKYFDINTKGKDYVIGDIHGNFSRVQEQLAWFFNPEVDRLFSVGDLVDRGPESEKVVDWFDKVHAVLGNHEQMIIDAFGGDLLAVMHSVNNGGAWFQKLSVMEQNAIVSKFLDLPIGIEVATANGPVGIVHADIPGFSWNAFKKRPNKEYALWDRGRIYGNVDTPVEDLVALYVGHTPTRNAFVLGNVHYMDNGAWGERSGDRGKIFQIHQIN